MQEPLQNPVRQHCCVSPSGVLMYQSMSALSHLHNAVHLIFSTLVSRLYVLGQLGALDGSTPTPRFNRNVLKSLPSAQLIPCRAPSQSTYLKFGP
jgi:hypothetical protein